MSNDTTTSKIPTADSRGLLGLVSVCLFISVLLYVLIVAISGQKPLTFILAMWFVPTFCAALLSGYWGYSKTAIPLLGAVPTVAVTVVATYQILFLDPFGELFYLPLFVFLAVGGLLLSGGGYLVGQRVGRQSLT